MCMHPWGVVGFGGETHIHRLIVAWPPPARPALFPSLNPPNKQHKIDDTHTEALMSYQTRSTRTEALLLESLRGQGLHVERVDPGEHHPDFRVSMCREASDRASKGGECMHAGPRPFSFSRARAWDCVCGADFGVGVPEHSQIEN